MAVPERNLLEAFQDLDRPDDSEPGPPREPRTPAPPPPSTEGRHGWAWEHPLSLALAALLVGFALGVLFHRSATQQALAHPDEGGEETGATGPDGTSGGSVSLPAPPPVGGTGILGGPGGPGPTPGGDPVGTGEATGGPAPDSSPLLDPANAWTLVCITYQDNRDNRIRAEAVVLHLRGLGLPVHDPVRSGDKLLVLAGAAPTTADLDVLRDRIRGTADASGSYAFQSAYIAGIDSLIPR